MLVDENKTSRYLIRGHLSKDELERIAALNNVELTYVRLYGKERGLDGQAKWLAPDHLGARVH